MKQVRRDASVHPKTVTAVSQQPPARRRSGSRRAPAKLETVQVHPEVWATALELAGGDASRLQVQGPTEVIVANRSSRRS